MIDSVFELRVPAILNVVCLYAIAAMCLLGLLSRNYHDNWAQAIGLAGLMLWALGRANVIRDRAEITIEQFLDWSSWQTLDKSDTVAAYQLMGTLSMVIFGLGTAWKVWRHRNSDRNPNGTAHQNHARAA